MANEYHQRGRWEEIQKRQQALKEGRFMSDGEKLSDEERAELLQRWNQLREKIARDIGPARSWEVWVQLANVHLKLGERHEAITALQNALHTGVGTQTVLSKLKHICNEKEFASLEIPEKIEPFWHDIPELLKYPLSGTGVYTLILGAVFITVIQVVASLEVFIFHFGANIVLLFYFVFGLMLTIFMVGCLCSYFISVMKSSGQGNITPPDWPDVTHIIENVAWPLYVVSLPGTVSFSPALAYFFYWRTFRGPISILVALIALGASYYPMALIASVMTDAPLNSANPIFVIGSILKIKKEYFIAVPILILLTFMNVAMHIMVSVIMGVLSGAVILEFIAVSALRCVHLYFLMTYAHILGLLFRQCESRTGL